VLGSLLIGNLALRVGSLTGRLRGLLESHAFLGVDVGVAVVLFLWAGVRIPRGTFFLMSRDVFLVYGLSRRSTRPAGSTSATTRKPSPTPRSSRRRSPSGTQSGSPAPRGTGAGLRDRGVQSWWPLRSIWIGSKLAFRSTSARVPSRWMSSTW
jgi:hypothetical protein